MYADSSTKEAFDSSRHFTFTSEEENKNSPGDVSQEGATPSDDKKNGTVSTDKVSVKLPAMMSKPAMEKLNLSALSGLSGASEKKRVVPTSPRGIKPLPRLPLPDETQKLPTSPRSPRSPEKSLADHSPATAKTEEQLKAEAKAMADSLSEAYRSLGSPRKEQPKPRRLESHRKLNSEISTTTTLTTACTTTTTTTATLPITATTTTTTTATTTPATIAPPATVITTTLAGTSTTTTTTTTATPATTATAASATPPGQADTVLPLTPKASDASPRLDAKSSDDAPPILRETGDHTQQTIILRPRRWIPQQTATVAINDVAITSSARRAPPVKYSKQEQMTVLVNMLVTECTEKPLNPNNLGEIGRIDSKLDPAHLPPALESFSAYLKAKKSPGSNHLMHAIFWADVEKSESWKKAIGSSKAMNAQLHWTPASGKFEGAKEAHLGAMLKNSADDFAAHLFKPPVTLASLELPDDFKTFLCMADQQFVIQLQNQDRRAANNEKGFYPLSIKNIEQARAYFLSHLLVTRFLQPMLVASVDTMTSAKSIFLKAQMKSLAMATVKLSQDFQSRSFEQFPSDLQNWLVQKSSDEIKAETLERGKSRFIALREKSSQRHLRSRSDQGAATQQNALEAKARQKFLRSQIDEQLRQVRESLSIAEFPTAVADKISAEKLSWAASSSDISKHAVVSNLLKTVRALVLETKTVSAELMGLEVDLAALASKELTARAQRRATMPISLNDMEFLNVLMNDSITDGEKKSSASTGQASAPWTSTASTVSATSIARPTLMTNTMLAFPGTTTTTTTTSMTTSPTTTTTTTTTTTAADLPESSSTVTATSSTIPEEAEELSDDKA